MGKNWFLLRVIGLAALLFAAAAPLCGAQASRPAEGLIVALGDSLTEGYGVAARDAYPARLEERLGQLGRPWRVINAGVSGETSSGTLARIDWILSLKPDIVILATGANDGLRGLDPRSLGDNLKQIIAKIQAQGVTVLLAGMKMVPNLGREYLQAFDEAYRQAAQIAGVHFVPFLLEGVAMVPELNQDDGIHPTPEGYRVMADHLLPYVVQAIESRRP